MEGKRPRIKAAVSKLILTAVKGPIDDKAQQERHSIRFSTVPPFIAASHCVGGVFVKDFSVHMYTPLFKYQVSVM